MVMKLSKMLFQFCAICTEMYTALVTNKRLLEKESGCYKFIFPVETVTFLCNKILQLFQVNDYKFHKPGK